MVMVLVLESKGDIKLLLLWEDRELYPSARRIQGPRRLEITVDIIYGAREVCGSVRGGG